MNEINNWRVGDKLSWKFEGNWYSDTITRIDNDKIYIKKHEDEDDDSYLDLKRQNVLIINLSLRGRKAHSTFMKKAYRDFEGKFRKNSSLLDSYMDWAKKSAFDRNGFALFDKVIPHPNCKCSIEEELNTPKKPVYLCRLHPTNWWHEIGCSHKDWTKEQLKSALDKSKLNNQRLMKRLMK
jgi:hypothetical protein